MVSSFILHPLSFILPLALLLASAPARADVTPSWMVRLTLGSQQIEGAPLAWSPAEVHLLGRDGRLWTFDPAAASDFQQTSRHFQSYSVSQLRALMLRELGSAYEATGTSHYLVVHPSGQGDKWAERFEDLYRAFVYYFSVRGLHPSEPVFPLLGIVCENRQEFLRYAAGQGEAAGAGVLGFYSPQSNRIALYDQGAPTAGGWQSTAGVVIHEATHQMAFNTGIHSRYAPPPHWLAEGLAMMFEAPGVYDSFNHPRLSDRIHRDRLRQFRLLVPQHRPEVLRDLVGSDRLFGVNPGAAYAESWALSFFLVETSPQKYMRYLAKTAAREAFTPYAAGEREADFTAIFGDDWRMLEARMLRFLEELEN